MKKRISLLIMVFFLLGLVGCDLEPAKGNEIKVQEKTEKVQDNKSEENQKKEILSAPIEEPDPIDKLLKKMTPSEKIGQLFMVDVQQDKEGKAITAVNAEVKEKIKKYKVGGVILFKGNIQTKEQTKRLIKEMQAQASIPLFVGVDEEGGMVSRVGANSKINKVPFKSAFTIGQTGNVRIAYDEAKRMGKLLKELGFNMDFAPVADIYNNPANTVIGKRSFGQTKEEVTPMVISFAKGLLSENVQPVLKHFPGHGNTKEDSHAGLAYMDKTKAQIEQEELIPFLKAADEGIDAVMRGHLIVKAIDSKYPATLSKKWHDYMKTLMDTQKILMITDAMNMGAIAEYYTSEEAAVMSFMAGNDIILMPKDLNSAHEGILKAYKKGIISEERLNISVRKILSKKLEQNILVLE